MSELDTILQAAYENEGEAEFSNKVYVTFFRTELFMPVYMNDDEQEPFTPLSLEDQGRYFIPVFDSLARLETWAGDEYPDLSYVEIQGSDVIRGVGIENVYISLNAGTDFYKEFAPDEIFRLKTMLKKLEKLKQAGNDK